MSELYDALANTAISHSDNSLTSVLPTLQLPLEGGKSLGERFQCMQVLFVEEYSLGRPMSVSQSNFNVPCKNYVAEVRPMRLAK